MFSSILKSRILVVPFKVLVLIDCLSVSVLFSEPQKSTSSTPPIYSTATLSIFNQWRFPISFIWCNHVCTYILMIKLQPIYYLFHFSIIWKKYSLYLNHSSLKTYQLESYICFLFSEFPPSYDNSSSDPKKWVGFEE